MVPHFFLWSNAICIKSQQTFEIFQVVFERFFSYQIPLKNNDANFFEIKNKMISHPITLQHRHRLKNDLISMQFFNAITHMSFQRL